MSELDESDFLGSQTKDSRQASDQNENRGQNIMSGTVTGGGTVIQGDNAQVTQNVYQGTSDEDLSAKKIKVSKKFALTPELEPETIQIPEGEVWMGIGDAKNIPDDRTQQYKAHLPLYRISKYPITNAQYAEFVRQIKQSNDSTRKWDGLKLPEGPKNDPVMGVTLDNAKAYCDWLSDSTGRKYTIPNEAQLEKGYQEPDGCSDVVDNLLQWTCTLWGAKALAPDAKYLYPWKNNEHNDLEANSQIRRVVCVYPKQANSGSPRVRQRSGKFPWDAGFPDARHSFRIVILVPPGKKAG